MTGTSWTADAGRVLAYRIDNLCIGDWAHFGGVGVKRISNHLYALQTSDMLDFVRGRARVIARVLEVSDDAPRHRGTQKRGE